MELLKTYIVEDTEVVRDSLIAALEEMAPIKVVGVAEDEATAVGWLTESSNTADLVIVDVFLKSGSGLGLLRAIGHPQRTRKLVILSNCAIPEMRQKCIELGASGVFDKSNDIEALVDYCERLASGNSGTSTPAEFC